MQRSGFEVRIRAVGPLEIWFSSAWVPLRVRISPAAPKLFVVKKHEERSFSNRFLSVNCKLINGRRMKLKRGDVTTVSVPRALKRKLDRLRGDRTHTEFLEELLQIFSPEVLQELDLLRRPGEGYGDVVLGMLKVGRRAPGELQGFLHQARLFRRTGKIRVVRRGSEREIVVQPGR